MMSNNFYIAKKHLTLAITAPLLISPFIFSHTAQAETPLDLEFSYVAPRQLNQVAFVPFAGDNVISPIIANNLKHTELSITTQNLPQQAHSSGDLGATLPAWQQTAIPYLVVGNTRSERGKVAIHYEVIDIKSGRVISGKQTLVADNNKQSLRYAGHVISDKIYELITGNPGDFSGRIAYIEEVGTGKNKTSLLKVMDADGENAKTLTQVQGSIFSPTWSPDGKQIAYSVQRPNGYPVIYIQNADGGAAKLVTPYKGSNLSPSFSPDGSSLLFSSSFEGSANIYRLQLGSGKLQKLTNLPSSEIQPSYAPDGKSFIFVSDRTGINRPQIYRYDFATGQTSKISHSGYAASPQFNHDGTQIAFLNGSSAAIMTTAGAVINSLGNTGIDEAPRFSPNGKRVVFASKRGNHGILTIKSLATGDSFGKSANGIIRSPVWSNNIK